MPYLKDAALNYLQATQYFCNYKEKNMRKGRIFWTFRKMNKIASRWKFNNKQDSLIAMSHNCPVKNIMDYKAREVCKFETIEKVFECFAEFDDPDGWIRAFVEAERLWFEEHSEYS